MKNDIFISILLWLTGLTIFIFIVFRSGVYLLTSLIRNKIKTIKISSAIISIQPHLLLFLLIAFLVCVVSSTLYYAKHFLPYPFSYPATRVVPLFNFTTVICAIAFFLTQTLLFYFAFIYRTRPNHQATFIKNIAALEVWWTIIPTLTFIFIFLWGQNLWAMIIHEPQSDALEIEIVGQQFSWWVRYPGKDKKFGRINFQYIDNNNPVGIDQTDPNGNDDVMPVQVHVVKNKAVKIQLRSKDVIHSFFIPYFRAKMDAVPGMITKLYFIPTTSTKEMRKKLNNPEFNYEVACAELCGRMHFAMKLILVVDEPAQFEQWYEKQTKHEYTQSMHMNP